MKTITNATTELDEVERCRRVRRALEQEHRDLDGLCSWLVRIERQSRRTSSRKKRPLGNGFKKRKIAISK